jgi:D-glycero-D-manno-heptose 1,7-bisphosphate phosphatase
VIGDFGRTSKKGSGRPPASRANNGVIMSLPTLRKAVFLDRDGVLVVPDFRDGRSFAPTRLADYRLFPGVAAALTRLKEAGYLLVVVTNQPDVGRGLIADEVLDEMHRRLRAVLPVDSIKVCRHTQEEQCACRKPQPGMILESASEFGILLADSYMVGDRGSDIEAGRAAGCRTVFIDLGYTSELKPDNASFVVTSIEQAVDVILAGPPN